MRRIYLTAIGDRPKSEWCSLPGRLRWTLLPKEHYGKSLSGRGKNTQPIVHKSTAYQSEMMCHGREHKIPTISWIFDFLRWTIDQCFSAGAHWEGAAILVGGIIKESMWTFNGSSVNFWSGDLCFDFHFREVIVSVVNTVNPTTPSDERAYGVRQTNLRNTRNER